MSTPAWIEREWKLWTLEEVVARLRGRTVSYTNSLGTTYYGTLQEARRLYNNTEILLISFDPGTAPGWAESWDAILGHPTFAGVTVAVMRPDALRWIRMLRWDVKLVHEPVPGPTSSVDPGHFPHVCPRCRASAYVGYNQIDCSARCANGRSGSP